MLPQRTARQLRADETRARIFAAAVRLFADRGYADTTIERIAADAGVAKGTVFVHFASKDALVTEMVRAQVKAARKARDRTLTRGGTAVDAMRATVMELGAQAGANRGLSRAVVSANIINPELGGYAESLFGGVISEMMDDVRAAQRAELIDPALDAEMVASTLVTSYLGATLYFATAPRTKPLLELLGPIVTANLAGFARFSPSKRAATKSKRPAAKRPAS